MTKTKHDKTKEPTVIKKYANRRLYDTGRSSYVTLDDLCQMVKEGHDFVVRDAKSNKDITRSVLTQIILDQESKEEKLLPTSFLKNLIGFYGDNFQNMVPNYLENTLDVFIKNQEHLQEHISKSFKDMGASNIPDIFAAAPALEEINRQNMAMLESAMKIFNPFCAAQNVDEALKGFTPVYTGNSNESKEDRIKNLRTNIAALQDEISRLAAE